VIDRLLSGRSLCCEMAFAFAELTRPLLAESWSRRSSDVGITGTSRLAMRLRSGPKPAACPVGRLTQGTHRCSRRYPASSLSRGRAGCELAWSRAARSAYNPRAVWLFTAPRLMPIAAAISSSDRPAS